MIESSSTAVLPAAADALAIGDFVQSLRLRLHACIDESLASFAELISIGDFDTANGLHLKSEDIKEIVITQTSAMCRQLMEAFRGTVSASFEQVVGLAVEYDQQQSFLQGTQATQTSLKEKVSSLISKVEENRSKRQSLLEKELEAFTFERIEKVRNEVTIRLQDFSSKEVVYQPSSSHLADPMPEILDIESVESQYFDRFFETKFGAQSSQLMTQSQLEYYLSRPVSLTQSFHAVTGYKLFRLAGPHKRGQLCCAGKVTESEKRGDGRQYGFHNLRQGAEASVFWICELDVQGQQMHELFQLDFEANLIEFRAPNTFVITDQIFSRIVIVKDSIVVNKFYFTNHKQKTAGGFGSFNTKSPFSRMEVQSDQLIFWYDGELFSARFEKGSVIEKYNPEARVQGFAFINEKLVVMNAMGLFLFHSRGVFKAEHQTKHPVNPEILARLDTGKGLCCYNLLLLGKSLLTFIQVEKEEKNTGEKYYSLITHLSFKGSDMKLEAVLWVPFLDRETHFMQAKTVAIRGILHALLYTDQIHDELYLICVQNQLLHLVKVFKLQDSSVEDPKPSMFTLGVSSDSKLLIGRSEYSVIRSIEFVA